MVNCSASNIIHIYIYIYSDTRAAGGPSGLYSFFYNESRTVTSGLEPYSSLHRVRRLCSNLVSGLQPTVSLQCVDAAQSVFQTTTHFNTKHLNYSLHSFFPPNSTQSRGKTITTFQAFSKDLAVVFTHKSLVFAQKQTNHRIPCFSCT